MTTTARERIAGLLGCATTEGAFSAARSAPPDDLHLEVRGLGRLAVPVQDDQASQLCRLARPARYGRGEQTLLDRKVRDTWEIPRTRVRMDKRRWNATLQPALDGLRSDLGLPEGCELRAELHSMLIYAPGQFFVQHQDSEKDDAMIGSLVVTLPGQVSGGALEVTHLGERATYRVPKKRISFVAFYGDCRHEIKPVKSGYRVVLTYNLLRRAGAALAAATGADPELVGALARGLDEHFSASDAPDRLVYLLDHEYTAASLDWTRLKGPDSARATALRAAADRSGCESALGLVELHEIWNAFEPEPTWRRGYRWSNGDRWSDDGEDGEDGDEWSGGRSIADDYEVDDLIDSDVTLESWKPTGSGTLERTGLPLGEDELCASTATDELSPYASEYEGYMGNYGNTLDRWYRRAAVLMWPLAKDFAVRAEASPARALDALCARVRSGDVAGARAAAACVAPFWDRVAPAVEAKGFFAKALRAAHLVDGADVAAMLLAPFRLEMLTPGHARAFRALADRYGARWTRDLVTGWSSKWHWYDPRVEKWHAWVASLPRLCTSLADGGGPGTSAATSLLAQSWAWADKAVERARELGAPSRRQASLSELATSLAAVVESASLLGASQVRDEVVHLLSEGEDLVTLAIGVLRAVPAEHADGLDVVAARCVSALRGRLARPPRADDDWSLALPAGCHCAHCEKLARFLADLALKVLDWPLAKDGRAHVHGRIDGAELPVTHITRRTGRPYTLVLTKTDAVFRLERDARRRDKAALAWLERQGFTGTPS